MLCSRLCILLLALITTGCTSDHTAEETISADSSVKVVEKEQLDVASPEPAMPEPAKTPVDTTATKDGTKTYSNKRFKDVVVERLTSDEFRITGKGQIFEASFSWYIEDGHNELQSGFATTDAGAPEWGKFDFVINNVVKKRPNSTLHLVLFETSAKDGSRQYELPLLLY
jgi:hypothetical protein